MTLFAIFLFLLAYYYFILRKYNTLGFRLFSLCFFVSAAVVYWWWTDWKVLKQMEQNGIVTKALVWEKKHQGSDWQVNVMFEGPNFDLGVHPCNKSISAEELAEIEPQQTVQIRYDPYTYRVYLEKSFQRQNRDNIWILVFPAILLLLGSAAWFFLRKYRVHPHEGTVYEYLTDEDGNVVLDDAKNEATKNLKKWSLISKILDAFRA